MLHFSSNATLFFAVGAAALIVWLDSRTGRSGGNRHSHTGNIHRSEAPAPASLRTDPPQTEPS